MVGNNNIQFYRSQKNLERTTLDLHSNDFGDFICKHEYLTQIDNSAKGHLTQFREFFTVIPCAPRHFKRSQHRYLKTFGSQVKDEGSFKVEEGIFEFFA